MAPSAAQPRPPIAALAVAGYGAVLGSLFPLLAIFGAADISGGLSVAADSGALVNTIQNMGAVTGILALPTLAAAIGRGRAMTLAGAGFLVASIACALAPSLEWMLAARLIHGAFGGALPLLFMMLVMSTLRPGAGQHEGMALFAASTSLLFGLAAALAAFLADSLGWRAIFWAQALAALPYSLAATRLFAGERGDPAAFRAMDWPSWAMLSAGVAMLVFIASEGERHFWFDAWWVPALLVGGLILTASAVHAMLHPSGQPLLQLSVFRRPTFAWGILLSLFFRFGLLFAIYIVPAFLGRVQGFRSAEIAHILGWMSPAALVGLAASWYLAYRIDSRWLLSAGLAFFAIAAAMCADLDADWAADQLSAAAAVSGLGLGLFAVAVLRFASFGAGPVDGPTVGVVFNLTRVLGNVAGLALLMHLVTEREKFHSAILAESLGATSGEAAQRLSATAAAFAQWSADGAGNQASAVMMLARAASRQAFTLAFADALGVTAVALAAGALLVWALPAIPRALPAPAFKRIIA